MADEAQKLYLEPWSRLEGKVVMVTGASSGLGREFCLDLGKAGCNIVAAAPRKDRLVSLCNEINRVPKTESLAVELDVSTKGPEIDASVQIAWDAFGRIDALVNNAGVKRSLNGETYVMLGESALTGSSISFGVPSLSTPWVDDSTNCNIAWHTVNRDIVQVVEADACEELMKRLVPGEPRREVGMIETRRGLTRDGPRLELGMIVLLRAEQLAKYGTSS